MRKSKLSPVEFALAGTITPQEIAHSIADADNSALEDWLTFSEYGPMLKDDYMEYRFHVAKAFLEEHLEAYRNKISISRVIYETLRWWDTFGHLLLHREEVGDTGIEDLEHLMFVIKMTQLQEQFDQRDAEYKEQVRLGLIVVKPSTEADFEGIDF